MCRLPAPVASSSSMRWLRGSTAMSLFTQILDLLSEKGRAPGTPPCRAPMTGRLLAHPRSEEHTSELQSRQYLVCRLLLEKKNKTLSVQESSNGRQISH